MRRLVSMSALIVLAMGLGVAQPAAAGSKLFVGGLPYATTAADVEDLVSPYGVVTSVAVMGTDVDGVMSAEATVAFEDPRSPLRAVEALDGTDVGGQPITAGVKRVLLVGSKVKEVVREAGLRSDRELVEALSDKVHEILAGAIDRCRSNHRSTVRPYDL